MLHLGHHLPQLLILELNPLSLWLTRPTRNRLPTSRNPGQKHLLVPPLHSHTSMSAPLTCCVSPLEKSRLFRERCSSSALATSSCAVKVTDSLQILVINIPFAHLDGSIHLLEAVLPEAADHLLFSQVLDLINLRWRQVWRALGAFDLEDQGPQADRLTS